MKTILYTAIIILLQGCVIEINTNSYGYLNESQLKNVLPFEKSIEYNAEKENFEDLKLFEIDSTDIRSLTKKQKLTWLHIWNPYCGASSCTNIKPYEELLIRHQNKGLNLAFISSTYDLKYIIHTVNICDFKQPIYVLENEFYGKKLKKIYEKLSNDLIPLEYNTNSNFNSDYLFYGDSLVFVGASLNDSIVTLYTKK